MPEAMDDLEQSLLSINRLAAGKLISDVGEEHTGVELVEGLIVPTLERIGSGWESGTIALSQVYMAARICEELVDTVLPPTSPERKDQPRMAVTVLEDRHRLGKRIVYSILRASGFELLDYDHAGVDDVVRRVAEDHVEVLLISTLMLHSALRIRELRAGLRAQDPEVKIVVGGAPFRFDDQLWKEVGADAMCRHASEVVATIFEIMGETS
ncbi:MAG: cobalamin-binding protein [bacterium]|nr:cobalamin-binding protein [bacterium]